MDNKKKELYKIDNNEFRESIDINEDDYFRQSKSINNNPENSLSQTKVFDNNKKVAIPFTTERIFKKSDFEILGLLGRGSYAKVVKAKLIENDIIYAIKIIDKTIIEKVNSYIKRKKNCTKST
jgi:3-phosphoinositide dependent protein kinase-1